MGTRFDRPASPLMCATPRHKPTKNKTKQNRQTELIKSQDAQLATLQQALRQEQTTNGVRRAYLEAAGKAKAGALGLGAAAVGAELAPALPPAAEEQGTRERAEVRATFRAMGDGPLSSYHIYSTTTNLLLCV